MKDLIELIKDLEILYKIDPEDFYSINIWRDCELNYQGHFSAAKKIIMKTMVFVLSRGH